MTLIKLCGIRQEREAKWLNTLDINIAGFVFYQKSRRYIDFKKAQILRRELKADIATAGVFVDEAIDNIASLYNKGVISIAQLHGHEDESYIASLKSLCPVYTVKAFVIKDKSDCNRALKSSADMILLDAGKGCGRVFDWSLPSALTRDYILAGGLDPYNIDKALSLMHPYGVDVSSGIESDGQKNLEKMQLFVSKVRAFDAQNQKA